MKRVWNAWRRFMRHPTSEWMMLAYWFWFATWINDQYGMWGVFFAGAMAMFSLDQALQKHERRAERRDTDFL